MHSSFMLLSHTLTENLKFNAVIWLINSRSDHDTRKKKLTIFVVFVLVISSVNHKNLHIKMYMYFSTLKKH